MKKKVLLIEGRHVKAYTLGKTSRPMTIIRNHLFRTDDRLFWSDYEQSESILIYNLDSTQPYGSGEEYLDPDETMALIDVARTNHKKSIGLIGMLNGIDGMTFVYIGVGFAIILGVLGWI